MSRYEYSPQGWSDQYAFVIGWDNALESYFGLVIDTSISRDDASVIVAVGGTPPPKFADVDNLMRAFNSRIKGKLPPVQLPQELRPKLKKDAQRTVVNAVTLSAPGERDPSRHRIAPVRPCMALGTNIGYLTEDELQATFDGMADQYFRLERLYLARKAAGLDEHNDEDTKRVRQSLGTMGGVCELVNAMVQTDALVAAEVLKAFHGFSAEAARVLQAESTDAGTLSPCLH